MKFKIIAIMGKAGSGKDTILRGVLRHPKAHEIISCTTRPMREGEVNGRNYHFISLEQYATNLLRGDFLEATEFNDWFYATPITSLSPDCVNVGVFNPEGIKLMLQDERVEVIAIYYIQASGKTRLIRQLNREEDPDINEILRRYEADEIDFSYIPFEYIELTNETPKNYERAVTVIQELLDSVKMV